MRSIAARSGVSSLVILAILSGPPTGRVAVAAEPGGASSTPAGSAAARDSVLSPPAGTNMRHGPLTAAVGRRDSLTAPPVDSLVARALAGSPDLAALEARAEGARRAAGATGGLLKLDIGVMYERQHIPFPVAAGGEHGNTGIDHTTMNMVGPDVELAIPFPGGGRGRREARDGDATLWQAELDAARRSLERDIRERYAEIFAIDRELASHRTVREMLTAIEESRRARVAAGASAKEALQASLAIARLDERCDDLEIERARADAALRTLVADRALDEMPTIRSLPDLSIPATPWDSTVVAGSTELNRLRARVRAAEFEVNAVGAMRTPVLTLAGGWRWGADEASGGNVRLGVDLPGLAGLETGGSDEAARAEVLARQAELEQAEVRVRSDAVGLEREWMWNELQRRRYADTIRPLANATFESARASLLDGKGELGDVLESLMLWVDAETGIARREADRFRLAATIDALVRPATPPPDAPPSNGGSR